MEQPPYTFRLAEGRSELLCGSKEILGALANTCHTRGGRRRGGGNLN